ncbi:MAG: hypothetical protein KTR31_26795 [Myxococcales bacterium]|nr:hypothetical protein [Myxococcales bacterium]
MRLILVPLLVACSGDGTTTTQTTPTTTPVETEPEGELYALTNTGNRNREGHTARSFPYEGGGVFAGDEPDNLFPSNDGVQAFFTINLKATPEDRKDKENLFDGDFTIHQALLSTRQVEVRGTPFEDLGALNLHEVQFDQFSRELWDLEPLEGGLSCVFADHRDGPFECDVTEAVRRSLRDEQRLLQFRLSFDGLSDADGQRDMALFYRSDVNATEDDIFDLDVYATPR